jgi:hypothetical protein
MAAQEDPIQPDGGHERFVLQRKSKRLAPLRRLVSRVPLMRRGYRAAYQARYEVAAAVVGLRANIAMKLGKEEARQTFARQAVLELDVGASGQTLAAALERRGVRFEENGSHRFAPAQAELAALLAKGRAPYPADAGLLLMSGASQGGEITAAAGVMHTAGVGPRVYDHTVLRAGAVSAPALVVESHPKGTANAKDVLRRLVSEGRLEPLTPDWAADTHFTSTEDGNAVYRDVVNFRVRDQEALVADILEGGGRSDLHFGRQVASRGGQYLYQSIPSAGAGGRRDSSRRWARIEAMLREVDIPVDGRVVLDVGCNAGMMLAAALAGGASWGLGWDRPNVTGRATEVLRALGYTRFDLFAGEMGPSYPLRADIPSHLEDHMEDAVVFYLAIRHHIGFLHDLGSLPWHTMVYEGGETETTETLESTFDELRERADVEILVAEDFRDGEGRPRPLAVLRRR